MTDKVNDGRPSGILSKKGKVEYGALEDKWFFAKSVGTSFLFLNNIINLSGKMGNVKSMHIVASGVSYKESIAEETCGHDHLVEYTNR